MKVKRLQHVSTPYPAGEGESLRGFYGGVLGLEELPLPLALEGRGLVWFAAGDDDLELHFLPEPQDTASGRHFCLEVDAVELWRTRLAESGYTLSDDSSIPGRPRFFCRDPFGNLLEFTTIRGDYRQEQVEVGQKLEVG